MAQTFLREGSVNEAGNEVCFGCGTEAPAQRVIEGDKIVEKAGTFNVYGICQDDHDASVSDDDFEQDANKFMLVPVCDPCHQDPRHRSQRPLKCHFTPRAQGKAMLVAARNQTMLVDEPTSEQAENQRRYLEDKRGRRGLGSTH